MNFTCGSSASMRLFIFHVSVLIYFTQPRNRFRDNTRHLSLCFLFSTCVSRCPPRSFPNQGGVCWPCHESCEICAGAGQDSCLSCAPAHLRVTDLAVCLQQCPEGYYESTSKSLLFEIDSISRAFSRNDRRIVDRGFADAFLIGIDEY